MDVRRTILREECGLTLTTVLPLLLVILVFVSAGLRMTSSNMRFSSIDGARRKAFYVADGGLEAARARVHSDRYTAAASTTYTAAGQGEVYGHPFSYTIGGDPMYPGDPTRKSVTAIGTAEGGTGTVVSQIQVFPYSPPPLLPPSTEQIPTCDWALFANRGRAELISTIAATTDLLNGNIHSNNEIQIRATAGATVRGSGRYESVNNTLATTAANLLANLNADLFRGGDLTVSGPHSHLLFGAPTLGVHFNNGGAKHGVQQPVAAIGFPVPDWKSIEQDPTVTIVEEGSVPFGSWDPATDTWVIEGTEIVPSDTTVRYFVRGNMSADTVKLARGATAMVAARGGIEIRELALLQSNLGGALGIGLNSLQTLRLLGHGDVFVGRGRAQTADDALSDTTRKGLNLTATLAVRNRVAAYSQTGTTWIKTSSITALTATELNLIGDADASFAVVGTLASTPTTYCQPLT